MIRKVGEHKSQNIANKLTIFRYKLLFYLVTSLIGVIYSD